MINYFILLSLFIYSILLFFINNIYLLLFIFIINNILSLILKVSLKKHINFLYKNLLFILFIIIFNIPFNTFINSLIVGIRLFLVIDYTFIISYYFNNSKLRRAFYYLFYPLKIFRVDINKLILITTISLTFIPILIDEARVIKLGLRLKGFEFNLKNVFFKPHIFLITYLNSLFNRIDELEKSLKLKSY